MSRDSLKIGAHLSAGDSVLKAGAAAVELGLNVVQLFLAAPLRLQLIEVEVDVAAEYSRLYGGLITIVHGPFVLNLANRYVTGEKYCVAYLKSLLRGAVSIGAKYIVLHIGSNPDKEKARGYIKHILRLVLAASDNEKIVICLETDVGGGDRMGNLIQLRSIVKGIKSPRVRLCIDTAHAFANGVPLHKERGLKQLAKYVDLVDVVHINEPDPKVVFKGHLDRHNNVYGTGPIGLENLQKIAEMFRDKVLVVECRDREAVKQNVQMLKEWLG